MSFTYGLPLNVSGGIPKVINEHRKMFVDKGFGYITIFPIKRFIDNRYGILDDANDVRIVNHEELLRFIQLLNSKGCIVEIHIHHLMCVNFTFLKKLLSQTDCRIVFFVHDFYTVCPSLNLINSNGDYCGEECRSDSKCMNCKYYRSYSNIYLEIIGFFSDFKKRMDIIAPSKSAIRIWLKSYPTFTNQFKVVPHQVSKHIDIKHEAITDIMEHKLNIAYIGSTSEIKGWNEFLNAKKALDETKRNFKFYVFSNNKIKNKNITQVFVNVGLNNDAMIEALTSNHIDVAILNSKWPETYSYTLFESLVAGAFVITNKISGNIYEYIANNGGGLVMQTPTELTEILIDEKKIRRLIFDEKSKKNKVLATIAPNTEIVDSFIIKNAVGTILKEDYYYQLSLFSKILTKTFKFLKHM